MNENKSNIEEIEKEINQEKQETQEIQQLQVTDNTEIINLLTDIKYSNYFLAGLIMACFIVSMLSDYIRRWK